MKRILFHSTGLTNFRPLVSMKRLGGVTNGASTRLADLKNAFNLTGNKGNMLHSEAVMKILAYDPHKSGVSNIAHLHKDYKEEFGSIIKQNFDLVVLSMANFIRKGQDHSGLLQALQKLEVPFFIFGSGLQTALPRGLESVSESTADLVRLFDSRAEFFSVRGQLTYDFLVKEGFKTGTITGCPSFYAFPQNMMKIEGIDELHGKKIVTAGHVARFNIDGKKRANHLRASQLIDVFRGRSADYIFQDEPFSFQSLIDEDGVYDDALCEVSAPIINNHVYEEFGIKLPFNKYYMFQDASAWRQAARSYDVYIGDRLHCGVACMQAGIPALFIASDVRMRELCEYVGFPHTTFKEIEENGLDDEVRNKLSKDRFDHLGHCTLGGSHTSTKSLRRQA